MWEWNEAIVHQDATYAYRGLRGGSCSDYGGHLYAANRNYDTPTYEYHIYGFRVSEVPEPATIVMLALAGVGMLRRRK